MRITKDNAGCVIVIAFVVITIIISFWGSCSSPSYDYDPDKVLTDEEYENKPLDELSDEEMGQAIRRAVEEASE